ncbi:MAG: AbrB/MazE/SpoVT family DNA-binding domain-containing protein [Terriglobia bacterium]
MPASLKGHAIEYMATARIGEKGQLTVPKQFREDLGLGAGAPFAVLRMGDGLILLPEQRRFDQLCERVTSALTRAGVKRKALMSTLPQARKRVFARHYGTAAQVTGSRQGRRRRAGQ